MASGFVFLGFPAQISCYERVFSRSVHLTLALILWLMSSLLLDETLTNLGEGRFTKVLKAKDLKA